MKTNCHCLRCGYDWTKRVDKPSRCPKCTQPKWDTAARVPKSKGQAK